MPHVWQSIGSLQKQRTPTFFLEALKMFPLQAGNSHTSGLSNSRKIILWGANTSRCWAESYQHAVFPYALFKVDLIAEMKSACSNTPPDGFCWVLMMKSAQVVFLCF